MHRTVLSLVSITAVPSAGGGMGTTGAQSASPARLSRKSSASVTSSVDVSSATLISVHSRVEATSGELDSSCVIHPFYVHKMDSGPVRLMTIAHAFNYRVAVLRDGVRSALRVCRSRKAEKCFLANGNISWGQQVTVMFQIVSTLMEQVPAFASRMRELRGKQPVMQFNNDPWGHAEECARECDCLVSDRTDAFVHCLIRPRGRTSVGPSDTIDTSEEMSAGFTFKDDCGYLGIGCAGSIPFVSERPGAYGRLLLAVYVRWKSGSLISSDWLRPVTWGAWRAVPSDHDDEPNPTHGPGGSS